MKRNRVPSESNPNKPKTKRSPIPSESNTNKRKKISCDNKKNWIPETILGESRPNVMPLVKDAPLLLCAIRSHGALTADLTNCSSHGDTNLGTILGHIFLPFSTLTRVKQETQIVSPVITCTSEKVHRAQWAPCSDCKERYDPCFSCQELKQRWTKQALIENGDVFWAPKKEAYAFTFENCVWKRETHRFQPNSFNAHFHAKHVKGEQQTKHVYVNHFSKQEKCPLLLDVDMTARCVQRSLAMYEITMSKTTASTFVTAKKNTLRSVAILVDLRAFYKVIGHILTHKLGNQEGVINTILWFVIPPIAYCPSDIQGANREIGQWCGRDATPRETVRYLLSGSQDGSDRDKLSCFLRIYGERMYRRAAWEETNHYLPGEDVFEAETKIDYFQKCAKTRLTSMRRTTQCIEWYAEKRNLDEKVTEQEKAIRIKAWPAFFDCHKQLLLASFRLFLQHADHDRCKTFLGYAGGSEKAPFLSYASRSEWREEEQERKKLARQQKKEADLPLQVD